MSRLSSESTNATSNPLADPKWAPVVDVLRRVVFKRDKRSRQITVQDLKEALRYLRVYSKAEEFLKNELGLMDLPDPANEAELQALLAVDNHGQAKLRFEAIAGMIFKKALVRYNEFLYLPPQSGLVALQRVFQKLFSAGKSIPGQEGAAREAAIKLSLALTEKRSSLPGTLLLYGLPGWGAPQMCQALAGAISTFGYEVLEIDMADYQEGEGRSLCGGQAYWVGAGAGIVTSFLHRNPKGVVVVNNIDRTLPSVAEAFLSPISKGYWTDQYGLEPGDEGHRVMHNRKPTTVDCRDALFLFTASVAGAEWFQSTEYKNFVGSAFCKTMLLQSMKDATQVHRGATIPVFNSQLLDQIGQSLVLLTPVEWSTLRISAKHALKKACQEMGKRLSCQIAVGSPNEIVELHLLVSAPGIGGIAACDAKAFESSVLGCFVDWCVDNQAQAAIKLDIDERTKQRLREIIGELGDDPIGGLSRKTQNVTYRVVFENDETQGVTFWICDLELAITPRLQNYSRPIHVEASLPDAKLADVVGHDEIRTYFSQVIDYLHKPERLAVVGVELPKGVLLYGPPGTGKTFLAKAFAGEAALPFISLTGSDLLYQERLAEVYRIAHYHAPCIIYIDECDTIGRRGEHGAAHDTAINTLLSSIQGFSSERPIFHILATNRPEFIDLALLRPGRIDRRFSVGPLACKARAEMLRRLVGVAQLSSNHIERLLPLTSGATAAELAWIIRETGLYRLRQEADRPLSIDEVIAQVHRLRLGEQRDGLVLDSVYRRRVAIHEVGHALMHTLLQPQLPIEAISIIQRIGSAGLVAVNTENLPVSDETPGVVRNWLVCRLAGRAAERIAFGEQEGRSSGASDDLAIATRVAYRAVAQAGLDPEIVGSILGFRDFGEDPPLPLLTRAWERTEDWLREAESVAIDSLRRNWELLEHLAEILLQRETVDGTAFAEEIRCFQETKAVKAA